jgi:glycosyltransferase 2 family protein
VSGAPAVERGRRLLRSRPVQIAFLGLAFGLLAWVLITRWDDVRDSIADIGLWRSSVALVLGVGATCIGSLVWATFLRRFQPDRPLLPPLRAYGASLLGKYVPGGVWPTVIQAEMAAQAQVPRRFSLSASVVAMSVAVVTAALLGVGLLPFAIDGSGVSPWWMLFVVPLGFLVARPQLFTRLIDGVLRRLGSDPLDPPVSGGAMLAAAGWAGLGWLLFGGHLAVLAWPFGSGGLDLVLFCVGAFALAWTLGFVVVVAPAGAGVRDVVLVAILTTRLTEDEALAVALMSRFLLTAGDLLIASLSLAWTRLSRDDSPARSAG